jgi:hypothetical protein
MPSSLVKYIGIPYVLNARDGFAATDCWGLVRLIYNEELGIPLPIYGEIDTKDLLSAAKRIKKQSSGLPWIDVKEPQDFDVVLMRHGPHSNFPGHVGVWFDGYILHALDRMDSVLARATHLSVAWRILGYRRHAECNPNRLS